MVQLYFVVAPGVNMMGKYYEKTRMALAVSYAATGLSCMQVQNGYYRVKAKLRSTFAPVRSHQKFDDIVSKMKQIYGHSKTAATLMRLCDTVGQKNEEGYLIEKAENYPTVFEQFFHCQEMLKIFSWFRENPDDFFRYAQNLELIGYLPKSDTTEMMNMWHAISQYSLDSVVAEAIKLLPYVGTRKMCHMLKSKKWEEKLIFHLGSHLSERAGDEQSREKLSAFLNTLWTLPNFMDFASETSVVMLWGAYQKEPMIFDYIRLAEQKGLSKMEHPDSAATSFIISSRNIESILDFFVRYPDLSTDTFFRLLTLFGCTHGEKSVIRTMTRWCESHEISELETLLQKRVNDILAVLYNRPKLSCVLDESCDSFLDPYEYDPVLMLGNIIRYALANNKKHFLQIVEDGEISGDELSYLSDHFATATENIRLNGWNPKEIIDAAKNDLLSCIEQSEIKDHVFTYQEALTLSKLQSFGKKNEVKAYINFFVKMLSRIRSEDACVRTIQYCTNTKFLQEEKFSLVCEALARKDLPAWRDQLFSFHAPLSLAAQAIACDQSIYPMLRTATNETEAIFLMENVELCKDSLESGLKQFMEKDRTVHDVKKMLHLSERFYEQYDTSVKNFFMSGYGPYAKAYGTIENREQNEKFKLVVKAALSGKLNELRYTDLNKECCMEIPNSVLQVWTHDDCETIRGMEIYEDTSFGGIMQMGAIPVRTCMNYNDGMYRKCLLSYFDGNKKIVYVKRNGEICARAVIRLTKIKMSERSEDKMLTFTDVTETKATDSAVIFDDTPKRAIFLERCYSGSQGTRRGEIELALMDFVKAKALKAGCEVVISDDYSDTSKEVKQRYERRKVSVFITKSKAGYQYLDSFGGEHRQNAYDSNSNENIYMKSSCLFPCESSFGKTL